MSSGGLSGRGLDGRAIVGLITLALLGGAALSEGARVDPFGGWGSRDPVGGPGTGLAPVRWGGGAFASLLGSRAGASLARAGGGLAGATRSDRRAPGGEARAMAPRPEAPVAAPEFRPLRLDPQNRQIFAMPPLRGSVEQAVRIARSLGFVGDDLHWVKGPTGRVVVQLGDQLDGAPTAGEKELLALTARWAEEARAIGDDFISLTGAGELRNLAGDLSGTTAPGFAAFAGTPKGANETVRDGELEPARLPTGVTPADAEGRLNALHGALTDELAQRPPVLIVGKVAFAAGGIEPQHVRGLETLNQRFGAWAEGRAAAREALPELLSPDGVVLSQAYAGDSPSRAACAKLHAALAALGVEMLVKGNGEVESVAPRCDFELWSLDRGQERRSDYQILHISPDARLVEIYFSGRPVDGSAGAAVV